MKIALVVIVAVLLVLSPSPGISAEKDALALLRAAFLFNFTKYVDWPEGAFAAPDSPFKICILEQDNGAFAEVLRSAVEGRRSKQRTVEVATVKLASVDEGLSSCHIFYTGDASVLADRAGQLAFSENHTLAVSNRIDDLQHGAMIAMALELSSGNKQKIKLHVDQSNYEAAALSIKTILLSHSIVY